MAELKDVVAEVKGNLYDMMKRINPVKGSTIESKDKEKKAVNDKFRNYMVFDNTKQDRLQTLYIKCGCEFSDKVENRLKTTFDINREMDRLLATDGGKELTPPEKKELLELLHMAHGCKLATYRNRITTPFDVGLFSFKSGREQSEAIERRRRWNIKAGFLAGFSLKMVDEPEAPGEYNELSEFLALIDIQGRLHVRDYTELIFDSVLRNPHLIKADNLQLNITEPLEIDFAHQRYLNTLWLTYDFEPEWLKKTEKNEDKILAGTNTQQNLTVGPTELWTETIRNTFYGKTFNTLDELKSLFHDKEALFGSYNQSLRVEVWSRIGNILSSCNQESPAYEEAKEFGFAHGLIEKANVEVGGFKYDYFFTFKRNKSFDKISLVYLSLLEHKHNQWISHQNYDRFGCLTGWHPDERRTYDWIKPALAEIEQVSKKRKESGELKKIIESAIKETESINAVGSKKYYQAHFYSNMAIVLFNDGDLGKGCEYLHKAVSCASNNNIKEWYSIEQCLYERLISYKGRFPGIKDDNHFKMAVKKIYNAFVKRKQTGNTLFFNVCCELLKMDNGDVDKNEVRNQLDEVKNTVIPEFLAEINILLEKVGYAPVAYDKTPQSIYDVPLYFLAHSDWNVQDISKLYKEKCEEVYAQLKKI